MKFGKNVKKERLARGITQLRLSRAGRVTQSVISQLEAGKREIKLSSAVKIIRGFHRLGATLLTLDELL